MVRSRVEKTGGEGKPQSHKWTDNEHGIRPCDASPLPAASALNTSEPNSPTAALTGVSVEARNYHVNTEQMAALPAGPKSQKAKGDKRYLGVRVRMPVRDMLRNFRIANGMDPKDLQQKENKKSKGEKKRVNTSGDRRNRLKKWQTKSLEELAIIVEVLEEDLKTSTSPKQPTEQPSSTLCPEQRDKSWCKHRSQQHHLDELPPNSCFCETNKKFPTRSTEVNNSVPFWAYSQTAAPLSDSQGEYHRFESAYCRRRAEPGMICSPGYSEYQVPSPQDTSYFSPKMEHWWGSPETIGPTYPYSVQEEWNSATFFWAQMERQERILRDMSDKDLLSLDEYGRTLLHRAVDEGKRALVYVIAKRMAHLKKLDTKDTEGKTPLHVAAQRNQHLIVADLISLGANINERDRYGKTCLHLSAEYGYVRVLEVLKSCMKNGIYIDLEARDMNGLSALQHASVSLKSTVCELERSVTVGETKLHSLRKEQMMETLECLLQMECSLQCQVI
ncbi:NF-kappa-B inhibitor zeta [Colossoma macropomum]|uniref:NF-kappa-B inhibitor zeta n=1 Tax=Colossoma macropomum TaxID=42526 RepID=UPI001865544C|nr:NF-kappa-B inhibitor zeta [Colossoma macropomum]